jgi:Cu2+-exporting ATPase
MLNGQRYRLGGLPFITPFCQEALPDAAQQWRHADTVVWLASGTKWLAGFALGDGIKADALALVAAIQRRGLVVHLLSGDALGPVAAVASALGIRHMEAGALPADKLAYVQALQSKGRRVLMVGDGVNDAPVLAAASVSVAVGGGAESAQAAGDLVLVGRLAALDVGLTLARATQTVIRQNLWWALAYNLVALPLALGGWVTPWLASLGMAASSLLVVLNAIRLTAPRQTAGQ